MNRCAFPLFAFAVIAAGCSVASDDSAPESTLPRGPAVWSRIVADSPGCMCGDGSEYSFFERSGDPSKVMFYFEGGGACYSLETCDPNGDPTYSTGIRMGIDELAARDGLFDPTNPENPLADHSIVYVPYCTGDGHLGNATTEYSPEVIVEHRGSVNAKAVLAYLVENHPDAEQVVVTGASAGSLPTPLMAGLVADELPDAEIITFGDSSGAAPDLAIVNESLAELWGTTEAIPDWPETADVTATEWSLPGLWSVAGRHDPDITFARFDFAYDSIQGELVELAGIGPDQILGQIDATERQIEASGTPLAVYVAPGTAHTIFGTDALYDVEVEGVRLIDWITELVDGGVPADVHCVDCRD